MNGSTDARILYSGIDLHKRSCVVTTIDDSGDTVKQQTLPCDPDRIRRYFARLPGTHRATVEATSSWYWISDLLRDEKIEVTLAHAKYLKAISYAKVKTDTVDSETLAHLLRAGLIPEAHQIDPALREQRDVLRTRLTLVERRSSALCSIQTLCQKLNVPAPDDLPPLYQIQAQCHEEQVHLLTAQIRRLEKVLHPMLLPTADVQHVLRIPGIGKLTAFTIYLEAGDITRFASEKHFFSYSRLVPGSANSGGYQRHKRSKDGNRYLKMAFSHAGIRAVQYYPVVRAVYRDLLQQKPMPIAKALIAKELARIAYHVLRKGEPFNGQFKGRPLTRTKKPTWPLRAIPTA